MHQDGFDTIAFLDEYSIPYVTEGKNTSKGWVGLPCHFCGDQSDHLGVNLNSGVFSCWRCGERGGPAKLVKTLLDLEWFEAYREVERFSSGLPPKRSEPLSDRRWKDSSLKIPAGFTKQFPRMHLEYLAGRGFNPGRLIEDFDLWAVGPAGFFRWRVVAPIKIGGKIVSFVGRDVTGRSESKYLIESTDRALLPRRQLVYNLDRVPNDSCLIVEGPADVWRIGDGAVALLGTKFSPEQAWLLFDRGIRQCSVMFDPEPEAQQSARRLAALLSGVMDRVRVIEKQTDGDPGDMSPDEVIKLKKEVFKDG